MSKKKQQAKLFLELAQPNEDGFSRWVSVEEVDHKNGMKNEARVMQNEDQRLSDFQPLSKAANDAKRQYCKECKASGIRYDAKQLGYPMSYYFGVAKHHGEENDCIGCYWYDPLEFKRHLTEKSS